MIVMAACYYKKCGQCLQRGGKTIRFKKQELVARYTGNPHFSAGKHPHWLWGPSTFLFNGNCEHCQLCS